MPRKHRKKSTPSKATSKDRAKQVADAATTYASSSFDNANGQVAAGDTVTTDNPISSANPATPGNATGLSGDLDDATVRKLLNPMNLDDAFNIFSCLIQVDAPSQPHITLLLTSTQFCGTEADNLFC